MGKLMTTREEIERTLATSDANSMLERIAYDALQAHDRLSFVELREANRDRHVEWWKGTTPSIAFRGNEVAGEVGEMCNVVKKLERERLGMRGSRATKKDLAEELADVLITVDLLAMDEGIDLAAAVVAKFNATSEKYGLKRRLVSNP